MTISEIQNLAIQNGIVFRDYLLYLVSENSGGGVDISPLLKDVDEQSVFKDTSELSYFGDAARVSVFKDADQKSIFKTSDTGLSVFKKNANQSAFVDGVSGLSISEINTLIKNSSSSILQQRNSPFAEFHAIEAQPSMGDLKTAILAYIGALSNTRAIMSVSVTGNATDGYAALLTVSQVVSS